MKRIEEHPVIGQTCYFTSHDEYIIYIGKIISYWVRDDGNRYVEVWMDNAVDQDSRRMAKIQFKDLDFVYFDNSVNNWNDPDTE